MADCEDSAPPSFFASSQRVRSTRVSRACRQCRVRKTKCDGVQPCARCLDFERDCEFTSTRKQKVVGAPRTRILEARLQHAKALITRLRDQYPHLELDKDVSDIFGSPPATPGPQSDICGASDHSPGGGAHDTIDNKPCSAPNQPVGRRYGDPEPNETVIKGSLIAVDQPQLYHQALQSLLSRHPQVVFHGQRAMYSHTMGYSTIPATTESSIRQEETEDPYLEGSSWLHDDGYGPHCQQLLYNITGTF